MLANHASVSSTNASRVAKIYAGQTKEKMKGGMRVCLQV